MSLMKDGLWGIVSGTEEAPEAGTQADAKFQTRRDHALAIIVLSIPRSIATLSRWRSHRSGCRLDETLHTISKEDVGE